MFIKIKWRVPQGVGAGGMFGFMSNQVCTLDWSLAAPFQVFLSGFQEMSANFCRVSQCTNTCGESRTFQAPTCPTVLSSFKLGGVITSLQIQILRREKGITYSHAAREVTKLRRPRHLAFKPKVTIISSNCSSISHSSFIIYTY